MQQVLNQQIIDFWKNLYNASNKITLQDIFGTFRSPVFISNHISPDKCKLLVIGLNPSYSEDGWKRVFKNLKTTQLINSLQLPESHNLVNAATTNASNFEQLLNN